MTNTAAEQTPSPTLSYDQARWAAEALLGRALATAPVILRPYTAHLAGAPGKLIRAAALLACAQNADGLIPKDAVCFAAAIELLHLATLVHDDIIDDADTRRGIPTLQRKWGRRTAVICGDYLLAAALKLAASAEDKERYLHLDLPDYVGRICTGELRQQQNNGNLSLSVTDYLRIIRGKTAALFEASFFAGAMLATDKPREMRQYARLGGYVGMIFQLGDDCIDYDWDETRAKKPVHSDYEQGVITLPLIHTLAQNPALLHAESGAAPSARAISHAVQTHGGVDFTRKFATRYYEKALLLLDAIAPSADKKTRLAVILDRAYCGARHTTCTHPT